MNFLDTLFEKYSNVKKNRKKIRPLVAELFHADVRTDRRDEVNCRFPQFYERSYKPNSDNRPDSYCPLLPLECEFLTEACVIDYRSSAAETHSDILTHSTDSRRVSRLVGVQIGLRLYLGLSRSSFFIGSLAVVFGIIAYLGKSHAVISAYRPVFLIVTLFSILFIKIS